MYLTCNESNARNEPLMMSPNMTEVNFFIIQKYAADKEYPNNLTIIIAYYVSLINSLNPFICKIKQILSRKVESLNSQLSTLNN